METGLASRALLASLTINLWSGNRQDKGASKDVQAQYRTAKGAARVNKSLLPGAHELIAVQKYAGKIRTDFYGKTLPWSTNAHIMLSEGYFEFQETMRKHRAKFESLVQDFLAAYPYLVKQAQAQLGDLFNQDDYPTLDEMRSKFDMNVRFMPVASEQDFRVNLGDDMIEELKRSVREQEQEGQRIAMKALYDRIWDVCESAHERLSDPKAVFRDSLVSNAVELCRILPSLNVADDKRVDALRRSLEVTLCKHTPKKLRTDANVRTKTAADLQKIMTKMAPFMPKAA